jgi:transposase
MKPYSLDLRQKIIEAYQNSEGSQRQLARRFKVSLGFIQNLLTRYRQDGTLEPRPKQNGFPPKLAAHESLVKELVEQFPDATLKELTDTLAQKGDIQVSVSTLHYYLERLKLTRKKTLHAEQAETERVQNLRVEYWNQQARN